MPLSGLPASPFFRRVTSLAKSPYHLVAWSAGPEMISGVRASSTRIESTSSTIGEVVAALDELVLGPRHVVAQVVEAELVVRAVRDVARVLLAALGRRHVGEDAADAQAEELVDPAHHLGVALGQVVVDRDQVHALAGQRVQIRGQGADEGLALTGLHLGDVAEVQRGAAHHLHVVVALAEDALGGLADGGERLGQQVVEALAVGVPLLVLVGERPQLGVGEVDEVLFDGVDLVRDAVQLAQDLAFACTHDLVEDGHGGWSPCRSGLARSCWIGVGTAGGPHRNGHRKRGPRRAGRSAVTAARTTAQPCARCNALGRRGRCRRTHAPQKCSRRRSRARAESADGTRHSHHRPPAPAHRRPAGHRRGVRGLPGPGHPALDHDPLARTAREHAARFTDQLVPDGWRGRLRCTPSPSSCPTAGRWSGHARHHHARRSGTWRGRLLGDQGAPRPRLHHRGRPRRRPLGLHRAGRRPRWSGAPRSATRPPARSPSAPASRWRAPCAPRSSTRAYGGTAWVGSLLPSDLGLPGDQRRTSADAGTPSGPVTGRGSPRGSRQAGSPPQLSVPPSTVRRMTTVPRSRRRTLRRRGPPHRPARPGLPGRARTAGRACAACCATSAPSSSTRSRCWPARTS